MYICDSQVLQNGVIMSGASNPLGEIEYPSCCTPSGTAPPTALAVAPPYASAPSPAALPPAAPPQSSLPGASVQSSPPAVAPPLSSQPVASSSGHSSSSGAIIGGAVGGVVAAVIAVIGAGTYWFRRRRQHLQTAIAAAKPMDAPLTNPWATSSQPLGDVYTSSRSGGFTSSTDTQTWSDVMIKPVASMGGTYGVMQFSGGLNHLVDLKLALRLQCVMWQLPIHFVKPAF